MHFRHLIRLFFSFCQGDPGPRGELGREGSTGANGDPVRHTYNKTHLQSRGHKEPLFCGGSVVQMHSSLVAICRFLFRTRPSSNLCPDLQHPSVALRREGFRKPKQGPTWPAP